jgi:hypothetical protein
MTVSSAFFVELQNIVPGFHPGLTEIVLTGRRKSDLPKVYFVLNRNIDRTNALLIQSRL